jgi:hypothetical protein
MDNISNDSMFVRLLAFACLGITIDDDVVLKAEQKER